ncbi:hypothetical protein ASD08_32980 [Streptomyces sp. Root369]|nr:hypothetical protein ASD08_32980 [Streptomyces sp. Root369]
MREVRDLADFQVPLVQESLDKHFQGLRVAGHRGHHAGERSIRSHTEQIVGHLLGRPVVQYAQPEHPMCSRGGSQGDVQWAVGSAPPSAGAPHGRHACGLHGYVRELSHVERVGAVGVVQENDERTVELFVVLVQAADHCGPGRLRYGSGFREQPRPAHAGCPFERDVQASRMMPGADRRMKRGDLGRATVQGAGPGLQHCFHVLSPSVERDWMTE